MPKKRSRQKNDFQVKGFNAKVSKSKSFGAAGNYPGNRRFGTSVHRSVIEKYDIDSDWTRWRKGIEYFYQGAYLDQEDIESALYAGTSDESKVFFDSKQFSTTNADSRSHYTAKRTVLNGKSYGKIKKVFTDKELYKEYLNREEILVQIERTLATTATSFKRLLGERITDGETSANIVNVLTSKQLPAIYKGKTVDNNKASVVVKVPLADVLQTEFMQDNRGNVNNLIGKIGYFPNFLNEKSTENVGSYYDQSEYFDYEVNDRLTSSLFKILNNNDTLNPALLDIAALPSIFETQVAEGELSATFRFRKSDYQRFYGQQYLTGDVVKQEVSELSYAIFPFNIRSVLINGDNLELTAEPFNLNINLFADADNEGFLILADKSFTRQVVDTDSDGNYLHAAPAPNEALWQRLIIDIDPWYDLVFTKDTELKIAEVFCCSCPDFTHAVVRMPEALGEGGTPQNRQRRFPLPSAMGTNSFDAAGTSEAAGILQSWETQKYRNSFRICKHTVAAMMINKIKMQEPKAVPSFESRIKFEQRLKKDMDEVGVEFKAQLRRSNITTAEIVFMLAQGLNLNEIETAFVMLNSKF